VYPIAQLRRRTRPVGRPSGQVQQQQIHGPVLEEHGCHGQGLCQRIRRQHDEPLQPDASRYGLDGIQASGKVQIRGDPAGGLGLGDRLEGQSGLAARAVALEGYSCGPRQPAKTEDRIQSPKAGGDGSLVQSAERPAERSLRRQPDSLPRLIRPLGLVGLFRPRSDRESSVYLYTPARSRPSKASTEGIQSGLYLGRSSHHGPSILEQTF
jgi:hypothetical protein